MSASLSPRSLSASLLTLLLGLGIGLPTVQAASRAAKVSIGDVVVHLETTTSGREAELSRVLRVALSEELALLAATGGTGKRALVVSATLTKLSTERRAERARASASISLVLRRADDQVLFAELRGRASVEETSDSVVTVQQEALRGAVRGAVARLPEAVERAR
jgi:hypothetical protein